MAVDFSPAFRHAVHHLRDPDEFALAMSGGGLIADFLAPQTRPTRVEQFHSPGWTFDLHQAHVKARIRCPLPPGWASIGLMRSATDSAFHGFSTAPGLLVCNPPGEAIEGHIAPGFDCFAVCVPQALWERCRTLAGVERTSFGSVAALPLPPPVYARLERSLHTLQHHLRTASTTDQARLAARDAESFATQLITAAWELSATTALPRDSLRNRTRIARRAELWMRDHLAESIRVPDLCLSLGVSRRELEYAFRSAFGQSPRDFLHTLRLNEVRRALQRNRDRENVTAIAFDHGIAHLSRFAAHYRTLFGEYPSETRSKSRPFRHLASREPREGADSRIRTDDLLITKHSL